MNRNRGERMIDWRGRKRGEKNGNDQMTSSKEIWFEIGQLSGNFQIKQFLHQTHDFELTFRAARMRWKKNYRKRFFLLSSFKPFRIQLQCKSIEMAVTPTKLLRQRWKCAIAESDSFACNNNNKRERKKSIVFCLSLRLWATVICGQL